MRVWRYFSGFFVVQWVLSDTVMDLFGQWSSGSADEVLFYGVALFCRVVIPVVVGEESKSFPE